VQEGAVSATALVKYGSSKKSLEGFATSEGKLTAIAYADESNVSVRLAKYDREKQQLSITVKNNGEQAAYFFPRLAFIDESGSQVKVSGPSIREIEPSSLFIEEFPLQLSDAQMGLNKEIQVSVDYGGRRGFLLKNATYVVPLESSSQGNIGQLQPMLFGAAVAFVAFVLLLAAYSFIIKKRNKGI